MGACLPVETNYPCFMSVQEIKEQIHRLSTEEQMQLEAFLKSKRVTENAGFQKRVAAAHQRMDAGEHISSSQLRSLLAQQQPAA